MWFAFGTSWEIRNAIVEVSTMNRRYVKACTRKNDEELTCRGLVTCGIGNPAQPQWEPSNPFGDSLQFNANHISSKYVAQRMFDQNMFHYEILIYWYV